MASSLWVGGCYRQPSKKMPSIILITVDTLRADYLGCYGHHKNTSPNIDLFAKDNMLFENCLSHAPETRLSFASMLSGFLPHETKITTNFTLPEEVKTLPEILRQQGFKTAAVISNYTLRKSMGFGQGFMIYDDTMDESELVRDWPERTAKYTTKRAIELLERFNKEKLFMWIHYQDPHGPYTPPGFFSKLFYDRNRKPRNLEVNNSLSGIGGIPSYQKLGNNTDFYYYVSQYEGEIRYQDRHFKQLIDAMKRLGLYDNALIIFSSDHGEDMGEHNYYFAHGENLYNQLIHVPLIIRYGNELTGRRKDFVQHLDIVPTVFEILGMEPDPRLRGKDLRKQYDTPREIFSEIKMQRINNEGTKFSIVLDGLKLIYTSQGEEYELFKIKTDPHEEYDLIDDTRYQQQARDLKNRLARICNEDFLKLHIVNKYPGLTEEERRKLESLGYIQ